MDTLIKYTPSRLNIFKDCKSMQLGVFHCPPLLFIMMGFMAIVFMAMTPLLTTRYFEDPEIPTILASSIIAVLFMIFGNLLTTAFEKIAETNRLKSDFVSIASHQLRSPLSILKWTLDVMEREITEKKASLENPSGDAAYSESGVDNFMRTLHDTTENMIRLVNSLLEVSRIEARKFVLKSEKISLVEIAETAIRSTVNYAKASNIALNLHAEKDLPIISGDKNRLLIVVQNLIDNAIRYSRGPGRIDISINKEKQTIVFSIKDSGEGIPASQQKFIFQKFFRADNSVRFQTEGTGIGLYTSKAIIEALGGKMWFNSQEGEGSTFYFSLPLNR